MACYCWKFNFDLFVLKNSKSKFLLKIILSGLINFSFGCLDLSDEVLRVFDAHFASGKI